MFKNQDAYLTRHVNHKGRMIEVNHIHDSSMGYPWKNCDGHGEVTEWIEPRSKRAGYVPLGSTDHGTQRYYDWCASTKIALRDGWGLSLHDFMGLMCELRRVTTRRQVARAAVERDFKFLDGFCNDDWHYMGIEVIDVETGEQASLWGIESVSEEFISEVTLELMEEIYIPSVRAQLINAA